MLEHCDALYMGIKEQSPDFWFTEAVITLVAILARILYRVLQKIDANIGCEKYVVSISGSNILTRVYSS